MKLTFDTKGSGGPPAVPPGTHAAYCISVIDLGNQEQRGRFGGIKHQLLVSFEFPEFIVDFETDNGVKHSAPAVVSKRYTASMHPKSNLRKAIEEAFGKKFTTDEKAKNFDVSNLAGKLTMVSVSHNTSGDRTYANIGVVQACNPKLAEDIAARHHEVWKYSTAEPDMQLYERFPDWLQKVISERVITDKSDKAASASVAKDVQDEFNDDRPF